MNIKSILIAVVICLLAFGVGFGTVFLIKNAGGGNTRNISISSPVSTDGGSGGTSGGAVPLTTKPADTKPSKPVTADSKPAEQAPKIEITSVNRSSITAYDRNYNITVNVKSTLSDSDFTYEAINDKNDVVNAGKSSRFTVPQSESGVYFVRVIDEKTGESSLPYKVTGCTIQRMSKQRLESICNSGDYTTMRNEEAYQLSPKLTMEFVFVVGEPDSEVATSIDDICTRIQFGLWKSVSIMEIEYDNLYRVKHVKFKVSK